jgi:short subunit dehydrogenase-like uncharacterized protein
MLAKLALSKAGRAGMAQEFDVVVFGATSFVGQIMTRYLVQRHGVTGGLRWAIAGRSSEKLARLREELRAAHLPTIVVDAADEPGLRAMCERTRVVASTVGPYALYGTPLVKACAETGTDYVDLTGEIQWIARMIPAFEAAAKSSGARIVHCCGFDSIPSDLGVLFLQNEARKRLGAPCRRIKLRVKKFRGAMSGGTVASLMNVVRESVADPEVRKLMQNPFSIAGGRGVVQPEVTFAEYDADADSFVAPFIMAAINTRIVHRSNLVAGYPYGESFEYDEAMMTGAGLAGRLRASGFASGLYGFMALAALAPARALLERYVVPKPGEGPSPEEQEKGFYDLRLYGRTADGQTLTAKVTGDRDPGYGSTGKILGEAAACLALDVPKSAGGFWTPATILGEKLIARLTAHAGLSFEIV